MCHNRQSGQIIRIQFSFSSAHLVHTVPPAPPRPTCYGRITTAATPLGPPSGCQLPGSSLRNIHITFISTFLLDLFRRRRLLLSTFYIYLCFPSPSFDSLAPFLSIISVGKASLLIIYCLSCCHGRFH